MFDDLDSIPLHELNLGSVRLRRRISAAGFSRIGDLFSLDDSRIDELFDLDDAEAIIKLREYSQNNPEEFMRSITTKPSSNVQATDTILETARIAIEPPRRTEPMRYKPASASRRKLALDRPFIPNLPCVEKLRDFEYRAKAELDNLEEQHDVVMVYQAFDEFAVDFDEIDESFQALFEHYKSRPRSALDLVDSLFGNIFLIYVADLARKLYDGENLWGNLFEKIQITAGNIQSDFKRLFIRRLEYRNMPLYAADEEANYYFYTALLHGGLSADSWDSLWMKSLLPLAKEVRKGNLGFSGDMDGRSILKEIKNSESRFAPKKSVLNILEKAPDYTISPLFEASLRVALQAESTDRLASRLAMLTSYGLPDVAMQALGRCRERQIRNIPGRRGGGGDLIA